MADEKYHPHRVRTLLRNILMKTLELFKPFDMHVHFRQGEMCQLVAPVTASHFSRAVVMPNTHPAIRTTNDIRRYRSEILAATKGYPNFLPLMTFKIYPDTNPNDVYGLRDEGAVAGKVYPKGLTTNAEDGIEDFLALRPVYEAMERANLVLCLHGEMPGEHIEGMDRERAFLRTLCLIARSFPKLRIVMEHITTAAAVDAVLSLPGNVAASITVHHLKLTHDDVGGDRMRPHHYCKPVAKLRSDRDALLYAATSGCPKFFFGSDSAPHPKDKKECEECCAGVYSAPVALSLLAEIFENCGALDRLQYFVRLSAQEFYLISGTNEKIQLSKDPWVVPKGQPYLVPFYAGETLQWKVQA